jgi:histidinol dehydrogenase
MVRLTGQPQLRIYIYPKVPVGFYAYRPAADNAAVKRIIESVRREGDRALQRYTRRFDRVRISGIRVELSELKRAARAVDPALAAALETARRNIRKFAVRQLRAYRDFEFQIRPGVFTGQKVIPIERVGIYVPAGQYPLVSSLLMCAIPAQVAGVKEIAVCSPPSCRGSVHPAILGAADRIGIREIYRIGGAQAIAALAYGTATVKKVDKIVGPGNRYVAQAKKEVFGAVGVDFIAGPTEIMIIADESADPDLIAADLLAQAEHDREAVATVVTDSQCLAARINRAVAKQLAVLPSRNTAARAIAAHGAIIIVKEISQALHIANRKAPEHLELQVKNPVRRAARLTNYGSLFIGDKAAEALGDYSSGLNHTLPTNFGSRYTGGLGVRDFIKIQTTLRLTRNGLAWIGPAAEIFARTEGLAGHGRSIARRRENIQ